MKKNKMVIPGILTIVTILYTLLVKYVDVKAIGPNNSKVGFSTLNKGFKEFIGHNMTIYKISELAGYLLLLLVVMYGILGIRQLIRRKSIKKVDREFIVLGSLYVLMLVVYVMFEKCIINYRPVLIDNVLEASYPSSHTILSLCVGISAIMINKKYIKQQFLSNFNKIIMALMTITLLFRIISGVHWISDILGGVIISATLLSYFYTLLKKDID